MGQEIGRHSERDFFNSDRERGGRGRNIYLHDISGKASLCLPRFEWIMTSEVTEQIEEAVGNITNILTIYEKAADSEKTKACQGAYSL